MPRAKLGKPLSPIKDDLPPPTEAEIELMVARWDTFAPAKYRGLLSARPFGAKDPKARWFYDDERKRYISRSGHVVSPKELRKAYLDFKRAKDK